MQLTLALIKPDAFCNRFHYKAIRRIIAKNGFHIVDSTVKQMTVHEAGQFYCEHREKFFFQRLVEFISSGPLMAHILAHPNAIKHWRDLMGPSKVYRAIYEQPQCLRSKYGFTDTRNAFHGSDSPESARREIEFYFPEFNMDKFLRKL